MAHLPAIATQKYYACGDGRDLFVFFDATRRGGKSGEQEVMRFMPKPSSMPPNKRKPFGVNTNGAGEAHDQKWNLSGSSPKFVDQQKLRHFENDSPRDHSGATLRSLQYPILSPRVDPAIDAGVPFRRTAGLAASSGPSALTMDLPGAVANDDAKATAPWSARSAMTARSEADSAAADLAECPWDLKKNPRLKVPPYAGRSRTHWGGFWAV